MNEEDHIKRIYSWLNQDMKYIIELQRHADLQAEKIKGLELEIRRLSSIVDAL